MWATSQGNPTVEISHFGRMGLSDLFSNLLADQRVGFWEGEKGAVYWCMSYHTFIFSLSFLLSHFLFFFCLPFLFFLLTFYFLLCFYSFLFFPSSSVVVHCAQLRLFYIVCCDKIYHFTPQLLLACCGCPSLATHWSAGCLATTTTLRYLYHVPFPDKKEFCFIFLVFRSIPIRIRVGCPISLTHTVCT